MSKYKKGTFLNIVSCDPVAWETAFRRVQNLPSREHIEIWLEYIPKGKDRSILQDMARHTEVIVHGPFIHTSLVSHLDALSDISLRRCMEGLEFASFIEAKVVTFHAGTYPLFDTRETAFERLAKRFSQLASLKSPVVTLENLPVRKGTTVECLGRLDDLRTFQTLMPDVRFTLDIGHSIQNADDFELFLREKSSCIENIHLHDGRAGKRSHLRLGAGTLDLPKLIELLGQIGYSKYVSLETISLEDTLASWEVWLQAEQDNSSRAEW